MQGRPASQPWGARSSKLDVQTGSELARQWRPQCVAEPFLSVFAYSVGRPEFGDDSRWRHKFADAPVVTAQEFTPGMARRVGLQIARGWAAAPAIRRLSFRHTALQQSSLKAARLVQAQQPSEVRAAELQEAQVGINRKLHHGVYISGDRRISINRGLSKFPSAEGAAPSEPRLV